MISSTEATCGFYSLSSPFWQLVLLLFRSGIDFLVPRNTSCSPVSGSTSLGDELVPELAEAFLRDELGAVQTGVKVEGRDTKGHRS